MDLLPHLESWRHMIGRFSRPVRSCAAAPMGKLYYFCHNFFSSFSACAWIETRWDDVTWGKRVPTTEAVWGRPFPLWWWGGDEGSSWLSWDELIDQVRVGGVSEWKLAMRSWGRQQISTVLGTDPRWGCWYFLRSVRFLFLFPCAREPKNSTWTLWPYINRHFTGIYSHGIVRLSNIISIKSGRCTGSPTLEG